jgi:hypothetical protein
MGWRDDARRVVVHTPHYLDFDGSSRPGGRARLLSDLIRLVRDSLGLPLVVAQKGRRGFEATDPDGTPVIGLRAPLDGSGDAVLGLRVRRMLAPGDVVLYGAGAQGAFPFFVPGSKGVQHGIGWDGPYSLAHGLYHRTTNLAFARAMRSILCVDTNYGNWLRGHGRVGFQLAERCTYLPNYADLARLRAGPADRPPGRPLRLLWARRHERKRGAALFLDALVMLRRDGVPFHATLLSPVARDDLAREVAARGLAGCVVVDGTDLDGMFDRYVDVDVAVVPTLWSEGTSLAAVEAICAGVPVVATAVGGLGNLVVPEFNGVIVRPEAAAIAAAVRAYQDEDRWRAHRRNCLSMRGAWSLERWEAGALAWLAS